MATPESLVYRGVEGTGAAQIFGREGNPMRALQIRAQDKERKAAIAEAERQKKVEARNKKMMELTMIDPEKTFQPFNQQVLDAANKHRDSVVNYFDKGGNPDDPKFLAWNKKEWDKVNDVARRGLYIQDQLKQTMEQIKANPYLRTEHYFPKLFDLYMDENGNGKGLDEIDVAKIQNVFVDDPSGFDITKYTKDFMGSLKENVFNYKKQRALASGTETDDIEVKIKGQLYTADANTPSGVVEDESGNPVINATNDFVNAFTQSETASRYIDSAAAQAGLDRKQYIESLVKPQGAFARDIKTTTRNNSNWYHDYVTAARGGIAPDDLPDATKRWENLNNIITAFKNPDGSRRTTPSPEAKAAIGYISKNIELSGGDVLEAELVPGSNSPGNANVMGMGIQNSPNDRLVFKVRYGSGPRGREKAVEIDLTEESSLPEINSLFETAKSEGGKRFGVDKLLSIKNKSLKDLYGDREGESERNQVLKAQENEVVNKWVAGEGAEDLQGRVYQGKQIKSAKVNTGPSGFLGFGKKPMLYDVEFEDGSFGEIPLDYNTLSGIYTGKSSAGSILKGRVR